MSYSDHEPDSIRLIIEPDGSINIKLLEKYKTGTYVNSTYIHGNKYAKALHKIDERGYILNERDNEIEYLRLVIDALLYSPLILANEHTNIYENIKIAHPTLLGKTWEEILTTKNFTDYVLDNYVKNLKK